MSGSTQEEEQRWQPRLLQLCKELDVEGLRCMLQRGEIYDINAPLNKPRNYWDEEVSALSAVLEHVGASKSLTVTSNPRIEVKSQVAEATCLLLQAKADPDGKGVNRRRCPLAQCCRAVEPAQLLFEAGAALGVDKSQDVMQHFVQNGDVDVIDLALDVAKSRGVPCRDVLSAAAKKGSGVAKRQLADLGLHAERNSAEMLSFQVPDSLQIVLALADVLQWPCEAVLINVPRDLSRLQHFGGVASTILSQSPASLSKLLQRKSYDFRRGKIVPVSADGPLPTLHILCSVLDPNSNRELHDDGASRDPRESLAGAAFGGSGLQAVLLEALLAAMEHADRLSCTRLAVPAFGLDSDCSYTSEEVAGVFLNTILLFGRCSGQQRSLKEVAVVVSCKEHFEAYHTALTRLDASSMRQHALRQITASGALHLTPCPQPLSQASVRQFDFHPLSSAHTSAVRGNSLSLQPGMIGFLIHDLLSSDECESMVALAEKAPLEGVDWEYNPKYRDCRRAIFHDKAVANALWQRLVPLLSRDDIHNVRPIGWNTDGVWAPYGLNECLRVSRYDAGGHFAMHRDGPFVVNDDTRSVFTVLVYLNEGFQGGATAFESGPDDADADVIEPTAGAALVFTHDARHEGRKVSAGCKYVLRTDIMFRRVDTLCLDQQGPQYANDPVYQQCESRYRQSIVLQNDGDPQGSTEKYLDALELQSQLASVRQQREGSNGILPDAVWVLIFEGLSVSGMVSSAALSRRAKRLAMDSRAWLTRYSKHWSPPLEANPLAAWYTLFKYRAAADEHWKVACFNFDFRTLRYTMLGSRPTSRPRTLPQVSLGSRYGSMHQMRPVRDDRPLMEFGVICSVVARARGHYWSAASGYEDYIVGHEALIPGYPRGEDIQFALSADPASAPNAAVVMELLRWIFAFGFEEPTWPQKHPFLVAVPPHLTVEAIANFDSSVKELRLDIPYTLVEHASVLALLAVGQRSGVHVHLAEVCSVCPVLDGKLASGATCFNLPAGLGLDSQYLDTAFRREEQHESAEIRDAQAGEAMVAAALQAVDEVLECSGWKQTACRSGVALPMVITSDGDVGEMDWSGSDLVTAARKAFSARWIGLKVANVDPQQAVITGASILASSPEARRRFCSTEGAAPAPAAPKLHRW